MLGMLHNVLDANALFLQAFVQPAQCRGRARVLVAQALGELGGEHLGQPPGRACGDIRHQRRAGAAGREQPIGQPIGVGAGHATVVDLLGETAQVLDQDDTQCDRHRPQLADGQRLNALVGDDEAPQHVEIEMTVGMSDEGPSQAKDPRVAGERPLGQFRQLAVITGGRSSRISRICSSTI